jgi:hypothetical protein
MQPDAIVFLESLFDPRFRKRLMPIVKSFLNDEMKECEHLIKEQLKEVKELDNFNMSPKRDRFAMLILLHIKPLLNKLKLFGSKIEK